MRLWGSRRRFGSLNQMPRKRMTSVSHVLRPNEAVSSAASSYLVVFWIALALLVWIGAASPILPSPFAVIASVPGLWFQDGLGYQLWVSFGLNLQAIAIMVTLSLTISYATVMPAFRPVATFVSSGRFNGFCGLPLIFTLYIGDAHWIKVALLVYGMSVYTVPAVTKMMDLIPKENFDHARTLRMHEWRVVWEVVILGHFDDVIEIFRNTAAMGW